MEAPPSSSSSSPSSSPSPSPEAAPETFHTLSLSTPPPLPPHPASSSSSSAHADFAHHRPSSFTKHASFHQHSSPASPSLSRHSSFHTQDPKSRRALGRIVSSNFRHTPKVFSAGEDVWKGQFVPAEVSQRAQLVGSDHGQKSKQQRSSIFDLVPSVLQSGNRGAKKLLVLIILNITYSSVELVLGLLSGRVGLVSDAFHLTFGCGLLSFSLIAMLYTKKMRDNIYTYGYKRLEVMAAFTNAVFLLFLSFSLAVEALHAFIQDESEHKHYLIVSAVTNLFVNLLGVWFFRSYARIRIVYRKAEDMNHHSIFLHVLSDSIRSAGLILASWLLTLGVKNAETLCLGLVAIAVFLVVMPLFKATAGILLQMSPMGISASILHRCVRQVTTLEDVLECLQAQFWEMVPGFVVGTLRIQVKAGTDEQKVLKHVHSIYNDIGIKDLTVQIDTA